MASLDLALVGTGKALGTPQFKHTVELSAMGLEQL